MPYKVERQSYPRYPEVWKVIDISANASVAQFSSREAANKHKVHLSGGPKPSTDTPEHLREGAEQAPEEEEQPEA
jgi:hypothetical protein